MAGPAGTSSRGASQPHKYPPQAELSSWGAFAAVMLFLGGTFSFLYGLAAIVNDKAVTVGGNGGVIIADFTVWGWVHMILGVCMVFVAYGLFRTRSWARWTAVVFAALNAIAQVTIITAFPIWALIVITLDCVVIYSLTTNWYIGD